MAYALKVKEGPQILFLRGNRILYREKRKNHDFFLILILYSHKYSMGIGFHFYLELNLQNFAQQMSWCRWLPTFIIKQRSLRAWAELLLVECSSQFSSVKGNIMSQNFTADWNLPLHLVTNPLLQNVKWQPYKGLFYSN